MLQNRVTEVVSLREREWSCYGGGQVNGLRMIMSERWSVCVASVSRGSYHHTSTLGIWQHYIKISIHKQTCF